MSTKLKNMKLTSVDLVRAGANQEADICLYKSANPPAETTIDLYKSAITESLQSIATDESLSPEEKNSLIEKSIGQYHDRMTELLSSVEKAEEPDEDDEELVDFDFEDEEPLEKANPYHDELGRFTTAGGGGGGGAVAAPAGGGGGASKFTNRSHSISSGDSVHGQKAARKKIMDDMDAAPVGAKMEITSSYTKGPKQSTRNVYTKVESKGPGSNDHGVWEGPGGQRTGLSIATGEIKNIMNANGKVGKVKFTKSYDRYDEIDEI